MFYLPLTNLSTLGEAFQGYEATFVYSVPDQCLYLRLKLGTTERYLSSDKNLLTYYKDEYKKDPRWAKALDALDNNEPFEDVELVYESFWAKVDPSINLFYTFSYGICVP